MVLVAAGRSAAPTPPPPACADAEAPPTPAGGLADCGSEDPTSSVAEPLLGSPPPAAGAFRRHRRALVGCAACAVCVAVALLLTLLVAVPALGQRAVDGATLDLDSGALHSPGAASIGLRAGLVLGNAGPLSATVDACNVTVADSADPSARPFAWMLLPAVEVRGGEPARINLSSTLHVTDPAGFAAAAAPVLRGEEGRWRVRGPATLHAHVGITATARVTFDKILTLPATGLQNVRALNAVPVSSDGSVLLATSDASFVSTSVLEVGDLGPLVFDVRDAGGRRVGAAHFPSFSVRRGRNVIPGVAARFVSGAATTAFFRRFAAGGAQNVTLAGPVSGGPDYLLHTVSQPAVIEGYRMMYGVAARDVELTGSTPDAVRSSGVTTFFSDAPAPLRLGEAVMSLRAPGGGPELGRVTAADLSVARGANAAPGACVFTRTAENAGALDAVLNAYLLGHEQTLEVRGPVGGSNLSVFLAGTLAMNATFAGTPDPRSVAAAYYSRDSLSGYIVKGGPEDGKPLRGAYVTARNVNGVGLTLANVSMETEFTEPISYSIDKKILGITAVTDTCRPSKAFTRQTTSAGMFSAAVPYGGAADAALEEVHVPAKGARTFLSKASPPAGLGDLGLGECTETLQSPLVQGLLPLPADYTCCFVSVQLAGACRAKARGDNFVETNLRGTMDVTIDGGFTLAVDYEQLGAQLFFEDSITNEGVPIASTGLPSQFPFRCSDYHDLK